MIFLHKYINISIQEQLPLQVGGRGGGAQGIVLEERKMMERERMMEQGRSANVSLNCCNKLNNPPRPLPPL